MEARDKGEGMRDETEVLSSFASVVLPFILGVTQLNERVRTAMAVAGGLSCAFNRPLPQAVLTCFFQLRNSYIFVVIYRGRMYERALPRGACGRW